MLLAQNKHHENLTKNKKYIWRETVFLAVVSFYGYFKNHKPLFLAVIIRNDYKKYIILIK